MRSRSLRCGVTDRCTDKVQDLDHRLEIKLGSSGQVVNVLVCPFHFYQVNDGIREGKPITYTIRATA